MTNREAFRRNINRLMYAKDYNQADIVRYIGVTSATVSDWCSGKKFPRTDTIEKLAKLFGVSVFELVCEDDGDEERLLRAFRVLSPYGKEQALKRIDELKQLYWYDKEKVL